MGATGPLIGVTVVEVAGSVATAWRGRLLGQLGADAVLAEPPEGSPLRVRTPAAADWRESVASLARRRQGEPGAAATISSIDRHRR